MNRKTFERLKSMGITFSDDFEDLIVKPLEQHREKIENIKKDLLISYLSSTVDESFIYLKFKITTPALKTNEATIIIEEMNATNEEAVRSKLNLKPNTENIIEVKFDKKKQFDRYFWQDGFVYQATIICDTISAKTQEFKLKFVKAEEKEQEKSICERDLTVDEVKNIVKILRENTYFVDNGKRYPITELEEWYAVDKIFHRNGHKIKDEALKKEVVTNNSFENFTAQLNKIFVKYEINNCNRRAHFLAQIYVETERFTKTIESDNEYTNNYDPLRGRGLIHITLKDNYKKYTKYKKEVDKLDVDFELNYSLISKNLEYSADASGWYWKFGSAKGNINKIADKGSVKEVTPYVNPLSFGLKEHENTYNLLVKIFKP